MSPEILAAVSASGASILTAVAAIVIATYNARLMRADALRKDKKLDEIHVLVNSRLSEALVEITKLVAKGK